MVGEARERIGAAAEGTFDGEEDIAALPVPIKPVQIWVEGMGCRILIGVAVIRGGIGADGETYGLVRARRDAMERDGSAVSGRIQPCVLARDFDP